MKRLIYKLREIPIASETFIISNIAHAIRKGFDVYVIADKVYPLETSSQKSLINEVGIPKRILKYRSESGKRRRIQEGIWFLLNPTNFYFFCCLCLRSKSVTLEHVYHLKFYEKFDRDDVFHVHFATAISPLLNLIRIGFLKSKVIVTFHGYDAYILPKGNKLERLIDDYRKYVHAITVNSQFLKNRLVSQGFDKVKIHVIPVGIDCSKFIQKGNSRALNENFKLLSIGRLIPLKGHRFGIEVAKKLIDRGHDIQYTIAGYGELLKPLEELIADYKLEGKVFLIGKQSQEKIAALLQASDIFLMTSTYNRVNRREAFGMVSLEAQVAGVPVVGFNSGGFPETVIEDVTGFIVDDRDVDAMVLAVEKLLLNNDLLESMRKNATQHIIDTFDINSVAEAYFGLYQ